MARPDCHWHKDPNTLNRHARSDPGYVEMSGEGKARASTDRHTENDFGQLKHVYI